MRKLPVPMRNLTGWRVTLILDSWSVEIPFPGYSCGDDDLNARLEARREQIARFELRDPAEALLECFADALARLTPDEIVTLRGEVARSSPASNTFVEIIDGHLALREIAGAS